MLFNFALFAQQKNSRELMKLRIQKIGLLLVLVLFTAVQYLQVVNVHYHKVGNEKIIKHSHLFNKNSNADTPLKKHKHSNTEYYILQFFDSSTNDDTGIFAFENTKQTWLAVDKVDEIIERKSSYIKYSKGLRAPPAFSIS